MSFLMPIVVGAFFLSLHLVAAELIFYNEHLIYSERPEYIIIPKYSKGEVPNWSPGNGRSFIDLAKLNLYSSCGTDLFPSQDYSKSDCGHTEIQMLMFEASTDKPWWDYWADGEFCCTQDLFNAGSCGNVGTLIVPSSLGGAYLTSTNVDPDAPSVLFGHDEISHHAVTHSGLYVIIMAICTQGAPIVVDGAIESVDPYGYLPADQFGNLPFYAALGCMYLIIGVTWGLLCFCYRDQLMNLQYWISAVMCLGMLETLLLLGRFASWNDYGVPPFGLTAFALAIGCTKRAMSRILVMLVSLGYGVVRPSLGEEMQRVLYLGGAYFVLSLIYTLSTGGGATSTSVDDEEFDYISLTVYLLAFVDTAFYIWIFKSINNLMASLASKQQGVKYVLYRNFRSVLFVLFFFTCVWLLYSSIVFLNDVSGANMNWREKWTVDALWELIYFAILVAIAVLWTPSANSQRYAYSMQLSQVEDDEEWAASQLEMTSSNRPRGGDSDGFADSFDAAEDEGDDVDAEYGGRLRDDNDPFSATGAHDPAMAQTKKH